MPLFRRPIVRSNASRLMLLLILATGAVLSTAAAARSETNVAEPVQVVDIRGMSYWDSLTFVALQGIVNRDRGELFLIARSNDRKWMDWYAGEYGVKFNKLDNPWAAFRRFSDQFAGWCVVDLASPHTANIGGTYASLRDLVPITMQARRDHRSALPRKSVGIDLRGKFRGGSAAEIYAWALQNQWPKTNQKVIGSFKEPVPAVDISRFTNQHDTLYFKFEDSRPESSDRMGLNGLQVLTRDGRQVAQVVPGTKGESDILVANKGSRTRGHSRVARQQDKWAYRLDHIGEGDYALFDIYNQFKVSIAPDKGGPWKQVLRETSDSTRFLRHNYGADWVVAKHGQLIGLSSSPKAEAEYAVKERFYKQAPPRALVMGWHTGEESQHLTHASKRNLLVLCSNTASNFSFHQHVGPDEPLNQKVDPPTFDEVSLERDKVYVTYVMSDGDSPNFMFNFMHGHWFKDARGDFPMGWEMQMAFVDMAPGVMDYYYSKATENDHFIASASGVAYSFPDKMSKPDLRDLLRVSRPYFKRSGLRSLVVLPDSGTISQAKKRIYARQLGDLIYGAQEGYWETHGGQYVMNGMAYVSTMAPKYGEPSMKSAEGMVSRIKEIASKQSERPLFIPVHIPKAHMEVPEFKQITNMLGDQFKIVGPDEFMIAKQKAAGRSH